MAFVESLHERVAQFNDLVSSSCPALLPVDFSALFVECILTHHCRAASSSPLSFSETQSRLDYFSDELIKDKDDLNKIKVQLVHNSVKAAIA